MPLYRLEWVALYCMAISQQYPALLLSGTMELWKEKKHFSIMLDLLAPDVRFFSSLEMRIKWIWGFCYYWILFASPVIPFVGWILNIHNWISPTLNSIQILNSQNFELIVQSCILCMNRIPSIDKRVWQGYVRTYYRLYVYPSESMCTTHFIYIYEKW